MEAFWTTARERFGETLLTASLRLAAALLILTAGFILTRRLVRCIRVGRLGRRLGESVRTFLASFAGVGLRAFLIVSACAVMGVPMASIVAVIGAAGVAVGLALQGSLSNFAGGLVILVFKPFSVGDYISVDELSGTVRDVSVFFTTLVTPDARAVIVPNGQIPSRLIVNGSQERFRRIEVSVPAADSVSFEQMQALLLRAAADTPGIAAEPPPAAVLDRFREGAADYLLYAWCAREATVSVRFALNERVKRALDAAGLYPPPPGLSIRLQSE